MDERAVDVDDQVAVPLVELLQHGGTSGRCRCRGDACVAREAGLSKAIARPVSGRATHASPLPRQCDVSVLTAIGAGAGGASRRARGTATRGPRAPAAGVRT